MSPGKVAVTVLVVLNCFLLVLLLNSSGRVNVASGQLGTTNDRAGDYIAVTGQIGATEQVLYLLNTRTDQLLVLQFYRPRQWIQVLGRQDLTLDFDRRLPEYGVYREIQQRRR